MIIKNLDNGKEVETGSAALSAVEKILEYVESNGFLFNISKISKACSLNAATARYYLEALRGLGIIRLEYLEKGFMNAGVLTRNYKVEAPHKVNFVRAKSQSNSLFSLYVEFGMPYTDDESDSFEDTMKGFRKFVEKHGSNISTITQQLDELEYLKDVYVNDRVYETYKSEFVKIDGNYIPVADHLDEVERRYPSSAMHTHQINRVYDEMQLARYERQRKIAQEPLFYVEMEVTEEDSPALTDQEKETISLLSKDGVIFKPRKSKKTTFNRRYYSV